MKTTKKILSVILACLMIMSIGMTALGATYIGNDKASEIALAHAGVTADQAKFLTCEFDYDDGLAIYEVEFYFDKFEYGYDINARTGAVVKFERDYLGATVPESGYIGEKAAKEAAFAAAGIAEADAKRVEVKFDFDDGIAKYEVEFYSGNYEYDYEIDALTGSILKAEKERELALSFSFITEWFAKIIAFFKGIFA